MQTPWSQVHCQISVAQMLTYTPQHNQAMRAADVDHTLTHAPQHNQAMRAADWNNAPGDSCHSNSITVHPEGWVSSRKEKETTQHRDAKFPQNPYWHHDHYRVQLCRQGLLWEWGQFTPLQLGPNQSRGQGKVDKQICYDQTGNGNSGQANILTHWSLCRA